MITAHLTETEIQLYVAEPEAINITLVTHIQGCALCQSKADNYILLFKSIKDSAKPSFDFDLSALVIEQLPAPKNAFPWAAVLISVLSAAIIAVAAIFFGATIITLIKGMSTILFAVAGSATIVIIVFQAIEMLKDHQKRMDALFIDKTLQL